VLFVSGWLIIRNVLGKSDENNSYTWANLVMSATKANRATESETRHASGGEKVENLYQAAELQLYKVRTSVLKMRSPYYLYTRSLIAVSTLSNLVFSERT
jgi:hypothetical protein